MQLIMMHSPLLDKVSIVTVHQPEEKVQILAEEFEHHSIYFFVNLDTNVPIDDEYWVWAEEVRNLRPVRPDLDEDKVCDLAWRFPNSIYFTLPKGLIDA